MKKTSIFILVLMLLLCACGAKPEPTIPPETLPPTTEAADPTNYVVNGIMEYPDYTFSEEPSILKMRLKAVSAFEDLLSIRWSTAIPITYNKTGPVSEKTFKHEVDVTYAGTIYSNASTGIFQFLEFYDFETGRMSYPGEVEEMKETIGASCADAMIWGVTTVCNSITGPYYPVTMVYKNGYLPVGDYTYDYSITSYNMLPTYKIVEQNGQKVMVDAYTKIRPGDMLVSTPDNHGMMAIGIPTVIYKSDGSVDLQKSYLMIQDQRGGTGAGFYEVKEKGEIIRYSGRTSAKFTFAQLLDKSYIPVTTAEFAGLKDYEKCTVTASAESCSSIEDLLNMQVESNFPLAVVNVIVADKFGNETVIGRKIFSGAGDDGVPRTFALNELECLTTFKGSQYDVATYIVKIEVVPSTGERFIPIELPL